MGIPRWITVGLAGGVVGTVVWVLVGYFAQYEVGWIAWGIGFLVGAGVRYGAYLDDQDDDSVLGIFASVVAIGSIVAAKFIIFCLLVNGSDAADLRESLSKVRFDDEAMIAGIANEIAEERTLRGETINWPPETTSDEGPREADYPAELWRQAEKRWDGLGSEKQQEQISELKLFVKELSEQVSGPGFGEFFSPWDLLWFGLATMTAYKIGAGMCGTD